MTEPISDTNEMTVCTQNVLNLYTVIPDTVKLWKFHPREGGKLTGLTQFEALLCQDVVGSRTFPWGLRDAPSSPWEGLPFWSFL